MQVLHLISVCLVVVLGVVSTDVLKPPSEDGFKCSKETVKNQPATVAFCGSPEYGDMNNLQTPTSFTSFMLATPIADHYVCIPRDRFKLEKYCCIPNKMGETSDTPPSAEKVTQNCKKLVDIKD
ncbi:hypothetical protein PTTG_29974 [Puccinia triticina 1-1 BBBD Race 1]|uniref:Uncharacterized protein n=2 Tax=Puccinia triticina TaxID=208348 RepID=A0A180G0Y2_PUCT1|nr:uncharacterized protein PtA15_18A206 [Puccinia triticina]OAV86307.1 hypothetical protein PTTG_29974 [Puccinia triticina 1-1 BBBD Race 1]WAQ93148.1 hypothetical protein PtA15_18A206 [Puccinia triticina]